MTELTDLEPRVVWSHFDEMRKIPRCSGNEAAIRQHLVQLAAVRGWDSQVDAVGNLLLTIPATAGHEGAEGIVIQGHLDMVCEKDSDTAHDFETEGIDAYVDGDVVRARGTSLGADNAIGLALGLGLADDPEAVHGPLEILATVEEETGLTGATGLDASMIKGKILLNLDSEDEGEFYVGCAGGGDQAGLYRPARVAPAAGSAAAEIKVGGLRGGHSGLDIGLGRGNAILILGRLVQRLLRGGLIRGVDAFTGGSKHNAIPREAWATVRVDPARHAEVEQLVALHREEEAAALGDADPGLTIELGAAAGRDDTIAPEAFRPILETLLDLPHGVVAMSPDIEGLVQTSNNVAIVSEVDGGVRLYTSARSSVEAELAALRDRICARMERSGGAIERDEAYPAWEPDMASPILARCKAVFQQLRGTEPPIKAIHAGLECGIIGEAVDGMDMISFGPDIRHPHSPQEYVGITSVTRTWEFLKALAADLA